MGNHWGDVKELVKPEAEHSSICCQTLQVAWFVFLKWSMHWTMTWHKEHTILCGQFDCKTSDNDSLIRIAIARKKHSIFIWVPVIYFTIHCNRKKIIWAKPESLQCGVGLPLLIYWPHFSVVNPQNNHKVCAFRYIFNIENTWKLLIN